MNKTLAIQLQLPEDVNRFLRVEAAKKDISLKELCTKILVDYALKNGG